MIGTHPPTHTESIPGNRLAGYELLSAFLTVRHGLDPIHGVSTTTDSLAKRKVVDLMSVARIQKHRNPSV